jgi:hypothetical protein
LVGEWCSAFGRGRLFLSGNMGDEMTLLNWIPEIGILLQLFLAIGLLNFKPFTYRSLSLYVAVATFGLLVFFTMRTDLAHFDSSLKIIASDSFSYFGRLFSLLLVSFTAAYLHLHQKLSYEKKSKALIFVLFFAIFLGLLCWSGSILLLMLGWLGAFISVVNFILIESNLNENWIRALRQYTLPVSLILILFLTLFVMMVFGSGSLYFSDFFAWLEQVAQGKAAVPAAPGLIYFMSGVVLVLGSLLLHAFVINVAAPFGLSLFALFIFISSSAFWFRVGIPFLNISEVIPKIHAQQAIGFIFSLYSLRYAVRAVRTTHHFTWLSSVLFATIGIGSFLLLLGAEQALPTFYIMSLSFLFSFFFAGQTFQTDQYPHKPGMVLGVLALLGLPPLVMGDEYFKLIRNTIEGGLTPLAIIMVLTWFLLSVAAMQMLSKIILHKLDREISRKLNAGELFLIALYSICVITLTALKPALIVLLNEHPIPYLW